MTKAAYKAFNCRACLQLGEGEFMIILENMAAGRHGAGSVAKSSHLIHKLKAECDLARAFGTLKPIPSGTPPPARKATAPNLSPNSSILQIYEPMGPFSSKPTKTETSGYLESREKGERQK